MNTLSERLIIVSNRLPVRVEKKGRAISYKPSEGGLATGLKSFTAQRRSVWLGWSGIPSEKLSAQEEHEIATTLQEKYGCASVSLSTREVDQYYHGFSNKTLWPLFHYFAQLSVHKENFWETYRTVNQKIADAVIERSDGSEVIWVHDYQLMLVPKMIRDAIPNAKIGFFLHIPFPSYEVFRLLPRREELLEGVLGSDLIGFHTYDYARHFLSSVRRVLGHDAHLGTIRAANRLIKVDTFPMGIDYERFEQASTAPDTAKAAEDLRMKTRGRKIVLSIDRLDYTKGIPQRIEFINSFFKRHPEYREKVVFVTVAVPSRGEVDEYQMLKRKVDELVGRTEGEYGTLDWTPILYLHRSLPFHELSALYAISDVALITPLRDGMNLVAKEYLASKTNGLGVLILSELAGASKELGEALIINPLSEHQFIDALRRALTMPEEEQRERMQKMQRRLRRYDLTRWGEEFMNRLDATITLQSSLGANVLTAEVEREIVKGFQQSSKRLLLLDYDGTLVRFHSHPDAAAPTPEVFELLRSLSEDPRNSVVIISGRDIDSLERWFGQLNIGLIAEHGAWLKRQGAEWELIEPLRDEWKEAVHTVLEHYVDRTPGSFIEEKRYSLVWHYRTADPEQSAIRVRELIEDLTGVTQTLNLQVLEGHKVVEVKNHGINKGRAALRWASDDHWGFIAAIGDDYTDEDTFSALPPEAVTIRVGLNPSRAKYNLESVAAVHRFLCLLR
jgi:trehalose 6-phosphate synthase/phosphatase